MQKKNQMQKTECKKSKVSLHGKIHCHRRRLPSPPVMLHPGPCISSPFVMLSHRPCVSSCLLCSVTPPPPLRPRDRPAEEEACHDAHRPQEGRRCCCQEIGCAPPPVAVARGDTFGAAAARNLPWRHQLAR